MNSQVFLAIFWASVTSAQFFDSPTSTTTGPKSEACCAITSCNYEKIDIVQNLLALASSLENTIKAPAECRQSQSTTTTVAAPVNFRFTLTGWKETDPDWIEQEISQPIGTCSVLPPVVQFQYKGNTYGTCLVIYSGPNCTGESFTFKPDINEYQIIPEAGVTVTEWQWNSVKTC